MDEGAVFEVEVVEDVGLLMVRSLLLIIKVRQLNLVCVNSADFPDEVCLILIFLPFQPNDFVLVLFLRQRSPAHPASLQQTCLHH